jgi:hypothetical protein
LISQRSWSRCRSSKYNNFFLTLKWQRYCSISKILFKRSSRPYSSRRSTTWRQSNRTSSTPSR